MECPGRDLPKHPMPGSWGRPRQGRLERSARHEGSPAGIRFPGGVMMLFVFSWPATTRPSCALRCGIETQWAVRRRLTEPPPKSPGTVAGESAAGEETATMLRRHCGLRRAKCVLIGSNSATGASGGVKPHKLGGNNWRRNMAATSASVSDNNQRPVFASKRAFRTRRSTSVRRPKRSLARCALSFSCKPHCRRSSRSGGKVRAEQSERPLTRKSYSAFRPKADLQPAAR